MNLASQSVLEGLNACLDHRGEVYNHTHSLTPTLSHSRPFLSYCRCLYLNSIRHLVFLMVLDCLPVRILIAMGVVERVYLCPLLIDLFKLV